MQSIDQQDKSLGDQAKKAFKAVASNKSSFERKLAELQALTKSVRNAYEGDAITGLEKKSLEKELNNLAGRWGKYEASVEAFKTGQLEDEEAFSGKLDKDLSENMDAYIKIKLNVFSAIRGELPGHSRQDDNLSLSSSSSSSSFSSNNEDVDTDSAEESNNGKSEENSKTCLAKYGKSVALGILLIVLTYLLFYRVILAVKSRRLKEAG